MAIWRMRIARWILKTTNTHSKHVILMVFRDNNCYANALQCHVVRTWPLLINMIRKATLHVIFGPCPTPVPSLHLDLQKTQHGQRSSREQPHT
jgi:hypothetical protein